MNKKIGLISEFAYLLMAGFSIYLVIANWTDNRSKAYLFVFFAVVAVFMFFFKRRFRKSLESRNKN